MSNRKNGGYITFERTDEGLKWRVSLPTLQLQADGIISAAEGFTPEREERAAITAIRKQFQEWEQILKYR